MSMPRILVIDDEPASILAIRDALRRDGCEVLAAQNGEEGLQIYRKRKPLVIIVDLRMPQMDGLEFLDQIHLGPDDPCSVIVLTGHGGDREVDQCYRRGVNGFLRKPFNVLELRGMVNNSVLMRQAQIDRMKAEEALQNAYEEVEHRVIERTAELVSANEQLRREMQERKRAQVALSRSEEELRVRSAQLRNAEDNERRRISRELHDGIGQSLSAIKFRLEATILKMGQQSSPEDVDAFRALVPMMQQAIEETRRISRDLRPSSLDDLGILATLGWFCREFSTVYSDIRIEREVEVEEEEVPLPLKTVIYRILQEALNNTAKHSGATLVRVSLRRIRGRLEFSVQDNGNGFDPTARMTAGSENSVGGLGLASMTERTELSGGDFRVESSPGSGTRIHASWPIPPKGA